MTGITPFDDLIMELRSLASSRGNLTETGRIVFNFSCTARVIYIQMLNASSEALFKDPHGLPKLFTVNSIGPREIMEHSDGLTAVRLSYFSYLDLINRTGRAITHLPDQYPAPPLHNRIYLFRNKIIEHWDDYLDILNAPGIGMGQNGKIMIPYHATLGRHSPEHEPKLRQDLIQEFLRHVVNAPDIEGLHYGEYADRVFTSLEEIDPSLRSEKGERGLYKYGIPETLIQKLFLYSFPTPIHSVEDYTQKLISYFRTLPL